jgi:AP-3 complex subunit delta-1
MSFGSGLQDVINKLDEVGTTVQSAVSTLFKKDLHDLVSGLRANKGNETKYINDCVQEIKEELKSPDVDDRSTAVLKLTYLQMLGYNMDWASFRAIEVIANSTFMHKRIGYLAASQSFSENTDVILLITNLIRKDCLSTNMYDGGIALNCLSNICTPDLARDLVPDIVSMLSSARPYIRKKAVLVMYKIFLRFPDALRPSFPRLKEKLEDPESAVVCAAVIVICELAK